MHDRTLDGKPFQTVGAATEKARVASTVCVRGTFNSRESEDRSDLVGGRRCSRSARCDGDDASSEQCLERQERRLVQDALPDIGSQ